MSAFRNVNCNATYLFRESPCHYLTFIWHFKMLIKCNANVSIPGAMRNANVMQMKCNANNVKKCIILGAIHWWSLACHFLCFGAAEFSSVLKDCFRYMPDGTQNILRTDRYLGNRGSMSALVWSMQRICVADTHIFLRQFLFLKNFPPWVE